MSTIFVLKRTSVHRLLRLSSGIALLGGLTSCDVQIPNLVRKSPPEPTPAPVSAVPTPSITLPKPELVTVTVDVEKSSDIRVKVGDTVIKQQILADSAATRQRLTQERLAVQQQLRQLAFLDVPALITPNPELQQQQLQQARQQVSAAQERLATAKAAIAKFKQDSAYTEEAWDLLARPDERQDLQQRQNALQEAQEGLEVAKAQLQSTQDRVQTTARSPASSTTDATRTSLEQQLVTIEQKLTALKTVVAPRSGTIQAITPPQNPRSGKTLRFEISILATVPQGTGRLKPDPLSTGSPLFSPRLPSPLTSPRTSPLPKLPGQTTPLPSFSPNLSPLPSQSQSSPQPLPPANP